MRQHGLCGWYMVAHLPWLRSLLGLAAAPAEGRWFGVDGVAAGVFGVPVGLAVLVIVSLLTAAPDAEQHAWVDRVRVPGTDER